MAGKHRKPADPPKKPVGEERIKITDEQRKKILDKDPKKKS